MSFLLLSDGIVILLRCALIPLHGALSPARGATGWECSKGWIASRINDSRWITYQDLILDGTCTVVILIECRDGTITPLPAAEKNLWGRHVFLSITVYPETPLSLQAGSDRQIAKSEPRTRSNNR
jgi:hypothetical protein